jgi:hypothetical protein
MTFCLQEDAALTLANLIAVATNNSDFAKDATDHSRIALVAQEVDVIITLPNIQQNMSLLAILASTLPDKTPLTIVLKAIENSSCPFNAKFNMFGIILILVYLLFLTISTYLAHYIWKFI